MLKINYLAFLINNYKNLVSYVLQIQNLLDRAIVDLSNLTGTPTANLQLGGVPEKKKDEYKRFLKATNNGEYNSIYRIYFSFYIFYYVKQLL